MDPQMIDKLKKSSDEYGLPQYIFEENVIRRRVNELKKYFKDYPKVDFFYPYKTNDLPYLCKIIHEIGINAEVSSFLELKLALKLNADKILFNGPAKSEKSLKLSLRNRDKVTVIVDSLEEIEKIENLTDITPKVGIRLNLKSKAGRGWEKFGISSERLLKDKLWERNIEFTGLHFHIGSEIDGPKIFKNALREVSTLIKKIPERKRGNINFIDIGGGFASEGYNKLSLIEIIENLSNKRIPFLDKLRTDKENKNIQMKKYFKEIKETFKEKILTIQDVGNPSLYLEPGRWLVNPSFHLLCKVMDKKDIGVILNAGINLVPHLIYENHPIYNISQYSEEKKEKMLYGNLCMSKDKIGKSFRGKDISVGDIIYVKNIGAYSISESWQFINPKAMVVAFVDGEMKKVREPENFAYRYESDKF